MRLHLVISRHGLPATRVLWTTTAAASLGEFGTRGAAPASVIASSRNPNVAFSNGGYTIAQLLEDVNEVVPLETEPSVFDPEFSGQWGLEDYVVEVGGSECLHFMEVEGLLRDGDEVVIRALQLADLRARRLCGRHQIATDGKHLIDGVPFGLPFLKRATTSRPAITIPPRKKRRTVFSSGWDQDAGFEYGDPNPADEEGDGEWLPPTDTGFGKELSVLPVEHDMSMGTVIRHPIDYSADEDSDDGYEPEEDELESELKALKEDFEEPVQNFDDIRNQTQQAGELLVGRPNSAGNRPGSASTLPGGSLKVASAPKEELDDENSDASDSSSSDSSSDDSSSEEEMLTPNKARRSLMAPPGQGTIRTKKSNTRYKLRRRLSKLKEIGQLPSNADFAALRTWEEENGGWHFPEEPSIMSVTVSKEEKKEQAQREFEAKRQQLLRDLAACGHDVEDTSGKENVPPRTSTVSAPAVPDSVVLEETKSETPETERANRRTLDIASSQRLLFGSLGVRAPKTKEDEEAIMSKLAAQASRVQKKRAEKPPVEEELPMEEESDDGIVNWEDKLNIKATECVFDDITLTAPPFPFQNRWDSEADAIIRGRLGWNKKRKRKHRVQVYDGAEEYYEGQYEDDAYNAEQEYEDHAYNTEQGYEDHAYNTEQGYEGADNHEITLNYDEEEQEPETSFHEQAHMATVDDLPVFPDDSDCVTDLLECEVKPGAIIAFRQLDMSKATNWQPRMSDYRVAEVQKVENNIIHVRLAIRDWIHKEEPVESEDDGRRLYSGFEMPGFDDEEGEDDGHRELVYTELSDPKLLKPGPWGVDNDLGVDKGVAQEDSIVSVIADSMPNAQLAPPLDDMDLDETTFVTLVTAHESPQRLSDVPSIRTPGGTTITAIRQDADDEHSDSPAVPSPSFSGFHSARSSPGMRLRFNAQVEDSNLDGLTLVGEAQSVLDASNQDISALSFLSANESISHNGSQIQGQHDRQVVDEPQHALGASGSGPDSLLTQVHNTNGSNSDQSKSPPAPARSIVEETPENREEPSGSWEDILRTSSQENTDEEKEADHEDEDSLLHSNQSPALTPRPSPPCSPSSSSRSAHIPPPSAQPEVLSQKSKKPKTTTKLKIEPPTSPARFKSRADRPSASQMNASQMSELIDLTSSPIPESQLPRELPTVLSSNSGRKKSKKRLSRKF
ncbi:hypothetical protein N7466_005284 [Penicillium verhagenii]|uniref:uncharacterized protein n=1 Tax=Penicillium verhagenii TaxID=1562060 RepID=UPI002545BB89|nr:uncharacterized protein N7466_005284 [Penicillium verhagenii]KAJ5935737.1 hypothetical protein N7466_005284 [Penicillium verhagenii]